MDFEKLHFKENDNSIENQLEKPQKLYRGMRERNREYFDPKENRKKRSAEEDAQVFATPDKAFATMFLVTEAHDDWTIKLRLGNVWVFVIADKDLYTGLDTGGSVYEITDLDSFYCDGKDREDEREWMSDRVVSPSAESDYDNSVDAMIANGIQVYFVDSETFLDIATSEDQGEAVLRGLSSENQKRGENVRTFSECDHDETRRNIDREKKQKSMDDFFFRHFTESYQLYLRSLSQEDIKIVGDEIRGNIDLVENMLTENSDTLDNKIFSEKTWEAIRFLKKGLEVYRTRHPSSYQRSIASAVEKLRGI